VRISSIFGVPAHPLLVHIPIVLLPLAGVGAIAMAFSARLRARIGWIVVVLTAVAFVGIHFAVESGESLEDHVDRTAALSEHTSLAESMQALSFVFLVVVVGLMALDWWTRRAERTEGSNEAGNAGEGGSAGGTGTATGTATITRSRSRAGTDRAVPAWLMLATGVLVVVSAVLVNVQLVRVGHNGAKASWDGVSTDASRDGGGDTDGD
jgi:Predicted membrane protein (DUF2231)